MPPECLMKINATLDYIPFRAEMEAQASVDRVLYLPFFTTETRSHRENLALVKTIREGFSRQLGFSVSLW